jgi:excinuclease ABC subunit C
MVSENIKQLIQSLPDTCGVYIMKSREGQVLYIGKASSLIKRVSSHFKGNAAPKSLYFTQQVSDIAYIACETPEQALLLEAALIKEKKPKYNITLKDDKSYPYVIVTEEEYPRVLVVRSRDKDGIFFGPFTGVKTLKAAISMIRKIFPHCSCVNRSDKPCFYYHLKLCPAPHLGKVSPQSYKQNIENICKVLSGQREELLALLQTQMRKSAAEKDFEKAANIRDQLLAIQNLYSGTKPTNELVMLGQILKLDKIPYTIETIDVSCIGGSLATGSVVCFKGGRPDKNCYRRYRIRQPACDDFKMIGEVVERRYSRLKNENSAFPDLAIIDGGLAHVNTAKRRLEALGINIPVIGIAKKNEEIFFPYHKEPLVIPGDSPALHLIQRVRNEAHRFAIKYHLLLRKKRLTV